MTNVLVCIKRVADSSSEVVLTEDGAGASTAGTPASR